MTLGNSVFDAVIPRGQLLTDQFDNGAGQTGSLYAKPVPVFVDGSLSREPAQAPHVPETERAADRLAILNASDGPPIA